MIYIWYNPKSKCYQIGSLQEFKDLRKSFGSGQELSLLYKFVKQKKRLANKILTHLNADIERSGNQEDESTFYKVY